MKIELISIDPPCRRCRELYETLQNLIKRYADIELTKDFLNNRLEYLNYPTPVIIINGEVVSIGKAPSEAVLDRLIQAKLLCEPEVAGSSTTPNRSAAQPACVCA
jgi:predicted thioredoxin/glutaredoxin